MRRGHYTTAGLIEYHGYNIGINDDGKFWAVGSDITGTTMDEVKKAIRATEEKRAKMPRMDVWFTPHFGRWTKGKTTGARVGYRNDSVWVTWDADGRSHKEQKYATAVYLDSPENNVIIEAMTKLDAQINALQQEHNRLMGKLTTIPKSKEE